MRVGDTDQNDTTQQYQTVAELSLTDLSDEHAKADTDVITTTATQAANPVQRQVLSASWTFFYRQY